MAIQENPPMLDLKLQDICLEGGTNYLLNNLYQEDQIDPPSFYLSEDNWNTAAI